MRKIVYYAASILAIAIILSVGFAAFNGRAVAQSSVTGEKSNPRILTVTGSGKAFLTPDIVYINIGVHTEGADAADVVASNNTQSQKVMDALKEFNVANKDIQTANFSIYPQQQYDEKGKVTGIIYIVDNTVSVTLRDLSKVGVILDAAVGSGANSINSIQYDAEDKSQALSQARKAAVADAKTQASELADAAGVKLGPIQNINVYSTPTPMPVYEAKGAGALDVASSVPVSAGQLVVTIDVNIVYEIQ